MTAAALAVICKAPLPGRVKTRLCPPCSPSEAAALAEASLRDTLATVAATRCARRVMVLDGEPPGWVPGGVEVLPQRGAGLDERLAAAFEDIGGPALVIGMDTPQVTAAVLERALGALDRAGAVLGPAPDGGYWAIGLRAGERRMLEGVPMSTARTGTAQRERLADCGLAPAMLPPLEDVDDLDSARRVAREAPRGRFAAALTALGYA